MNDRTGPWEGVHNPLRASTEIPGQYPGEQLVVCAHSGFNVPISQTVTVRGYRIWKKFLKEPHPATGHWKP